MEETKIVIENVANIATAVAALAAAIMAVIGVNAWRHQMKGKTEYEVARRYLRSVYKVREAIKYVRSPYISVGEMQSSLKENGLSEEDYQDNLKTNRAVYSLRWKKVIEAKTELDIELFEAETTWGKEAVAVGKDLNSCIRELLSQVQLFLDGHRERTSQDMVIYDTNDENTFTQKINNSIEKIEQFLKPYMK